MSALLVADCKTTRTQLTPPSGGIEVGPIRAGAGRTPRLEAGVPAVRARAGSRIYMQRRGNRGVENRSGACAPGHVVKVARELLRRDRAVLCDLLRGGTRA